MRQVVCAPASCSHASDLAASNSAVRSVLRVLAALQTGDGDADRVDRACRQPNARCSGGHFLDGPPDLAGTGIPERHFIEGFPSSSRRTGRERAQVEQGREHDEVVGEEPGAADDAVVVMRELACRHRRPGAESVDDHVVEAPERAGVWPCRQSPTQSLPMWLTCRSRAVSMAPAARTMRSPRMVRR